MHAATEENGQTIRAESLGPGDESMACRRRKKAAMHFQPNRAGLMRASWSSLSRWEHRRHGSNYQLFRENSAREDRCLISRHPSPQCTFPREKQQQKEREMRTTRSRGIQQTVILGSPMPGGRTEGCWAGSSATEMSFNSPQGGMQVKAGRQDLDHLGSSSNSKWSGKRWREEGEKN